GDFPTTAGAFQTTLHGSQDMFVAKLNATGSALLYSTFLGGSSIEGFGSVLDNYLGGIAVSTDGGGNTYAYVTGDTESTDFPTTSNAYQPTFNTLGGIDAFVTKLNASGSALVYSTYLGGADYGRGIAVDSSGNAYVTGYALGGGSVP